MNVADVFPDDNHVRLIPEGKHRHVAADDFLGPRIKRLRLCVIVSVRRLVQNLIEFSISIATAIARCARFRRDFRRRKQIAIEDRILIAADPLPVRHLKLAAAKRFKQHIQL